MLSQSWKHRATRSATESSGYRLVLMVRSEQVRWKRAWEGTSLMAQLSSRRTLAVSDAILRCRCSQKLGYRAFQYLRMSATGVRRYARQRRRR